MIKLKDFPAKLHKYFSETFGVVNLNVENTYKRTHTHTPIHKHMPCVLWQMLHNIVGMLLLLLPFFRTDFVKLVLRYFHVILYTSCLRKLLKFLVLEQIKARLKREQLSNVWTFLMNMDLNLMLNTMCIVKHNTSEMFHRRLKKTAEEAE